MGGIGVLRGSRAGGVRWEVFATLAPMDNVVQFRPRVPARYGVCPKCGNASGILNIGKSHWVYCRAHRLKWFVGCSLLGKGREGPREWLENSRQLKDYREVKPTKTLANRVQVDDG